MECPPRAHEHTMLKKHEHERRAAMKTHSLTHLHLPDCRTASSRRLVVGRAALRPSLHLVD
jgi:hypothetical protein